MTEREIFDNALALSNPVERGEYLDEACAGDDRLRVHVEELLTLHGRVGGFLESPAVATIDCPSPSIIGAQIGLYKLREQIGEGGMGVVYVAEQTEPVRRKVALKIIKPGMATKDVLVRFEAERQALAVMDHPSIAKVHDGGATEAGQPYFVMELVYGIPITEYCDEHTLTTEQRLRLFAKVCRAVQHAHQKGVIHRDLKPSNVLVATIDGEAVPKVIDFGVAKAAGTRLTDATVYTQFSQIIGTPLYMSPEQAELGVGDVDTRSDVYALGVLLYELLTGQTPFDSETLKSAGFDEMRRIIREDEPPKPSAMLSTLKAEALSTISQRRGSDPRKLSKSLSGELDWIVMKAMEKDRNRRYESPSALAADVNRFLAGQPVDACPPTALYRLKKLAKSNKSLITTAAMVLVTLLLGIVGTSWQAWRATAAFAFAESSLQESEEQRDRYLRERDQARRNLYVADSRLAHRDWLDGDFESYDALLRSHTPKGQEQDFRGWEWYYLRSLSMHEVASLEGMFLAFWSPNGAKFAYVGGEHYSTIVVKDAMNWSTSTSLSGHKKTVTSCCWSPDGKYLASLARGGALRVWDIETSKCKLVVNKEFNQHVMLVAWSPDGSKIAVTGVPAADGERVSTSPAKVLIYDPNSGDEIQRISTKGGFLWSIDWSPDGTHLVVGTDYSASSVLILNVETGAIEREIHEGFKSGRPVSGVAWSKDGRVIAATNDGDVHVWDTDTWTKRWQAEAHRGRAFDVAWAPDSTSLASVGYDGLVKIWSDSGALLNTLRGHSAQIENIGWHPDGKRIASGSVDGTIKIWEAFVNYDVHTLKVDGVAEWLPDKPRTLGLWLKNKPGDLWSLRRASGEHWRIAAEVDFEIPAPTSGARGFDCISWSPDASRFALLQGSESGETIRVFDTQSGKSLGSTNSDWSNWVAWHPSKNTVAIGTHKGAVIWDWENQQQVASVNGIWGCLAGVWSPDGALLAMCSQKQELIVFHTDTWQICFQIDLSGIWNAAGRRKIAWSSDGKFLAAGSSGGEVYVWDTSNWQQHLRWRGETGAINSVAISPDNRRLATGGDNGIVKIWDFSDGKQLLLLDHNLGRIDRLSWSPDGTCLLAKEWTTYHIWDASPALEDEARKEMQSEK